MGSPVHAYRVFHAISRENESGASRYVLRMLSPRLVSFMSKRSIAYHEHVAAARDESESRGKDM